MTTLVSMRFSRNSIAAIATIAALGILATVALASGGNKPRAPPAPTAETDPPAQVRTETVHRLTARARRRAFGLESTDDDGTADQGPGDAPGTAGSRRTDDGTADQGPGVATSRGADDVGPTRPRRRRRRPATTTQRRRVRNSGHGGGDDSVTATRVAVSSQIDVVELAFPATGHPGAVAGRTWRATGRRAGGDDD